MSQKIDEETKHLPTIINTNCRSVCNKLDYLSQLTEDTSPDLVTLTETWVTSANEQVIIRQIQQQNSEYQVFSRKRSREDVSRGGGVMIMVNRNYATDIREIETPSCTNNETILETLVVRINPTRKPRGYSSVLVVAAYIPPSSPIEMSRASFQLNNVIQEASQLGKNSLVPLIFAAGDLNGISLDHINRANSLHRVNKKATRKEKLLDPILTNAPRCYRCINLPPLGNSDHEMVKAFPKFKKYKSTRAKSAKCKTRTGSIQDTICELGNIDWNATINSKDLNCQQKFDIFYDTIKDVMDTCQPLKVAKIKGDQPWMTPEIKRQVIIRQQLLKGKQNNWRAWKDQTNLVARMIKKRKQKYYSQFTKPDSNCWKAINNLRLAKNEDAALQPKTIDQLNDQFYRVWGGKLQPDLSCFHPRTPRLDPMDEGISAQDVLKELADLKPNKAPGPDQLDARVLKEARHELLDVITHLFDLCLRNSFVPTQWKCANIIPVPKNSKPKDPSDYRPISLTSTLCKVFERILSKRILGLTKSIWLDNQQFGFLPKRNTTQAIAQVVDDWSKALDQRKSVHAIFFDFSKAFDLVDHRILLDKLAKILPVCITSWIAEYLSNRSQRVFSKQYQSEWKPVEAGVIQGSVLGPTLFVLFLADIVDYIPDRVSAPKYADDILANQIIRSSEENPRSCERYRQLVSNQLHEAEPGKDQTDDSQRTRPDPTCLHKWLGY